MNKYLLLSICYILSPICNAQIVIGNLKIEPTTKNNEIKITNISDKTIDNIQLNGRLAPLEVRSLKPNEERKIILTPSEEMSKQQRKEQIEKEKRALADLISEPKS